MEQAQRKERILVWLLRIAGALTVTAFPAVLLPTAWMAAIHEWLGLGVFPDQPIGGYLALFGMLVLYLHRSVAVD